MPPVHLHGDGVWRTGAWAAGVILAICALTPLLVILTAGVGPIAQAAVGTGGVATALAFVAAALFVQRRDAIDVFSPRFEGRPITGRALELVADITQRFAYAERQIHSIPTGIDWRDVEFEVDTLLWEAAERAAELSESEDALADLVYAEPGTPQAALKARLIERRADHEAILQGFRLSADRLARTAGNAAAAARVALEHDHDVRELAAVLPSLEAEAARERLDDLVMRLDAIAGAWRALDASTDLEAERLRGEIGP